MGSNLHLAGGRKLALASLRDREGVEQSRNFERAAYDHVATVAISGVTGRRVWHPSISQEISSPSLWRQQVTTLTSPTQRCSSRSLWQIETGFPPPKAARSMRLKGELPVEQTEPNYFDELLGILTEEELIRFRHRFKKAGKLRLVEVLADEIQKRHSSKKSLSSDQSSQAIPHGALDKPGDGHR